MSTRAAPRARRSSSRTWRRGSTAARSREQVLDTLGRAGFVARGVVYLLVGWIALLKFVLIAMAVGLAAFGLYSFCEARWRRL